MNWSNLRDCKCPRPGCNGKLEAEGMLDTRMVCQQPECDFSIGEPRFNEIINSMYSPKKRGEVDPDANLSALNNM